MSKTPRVRRPKKRRLTKSVLKERKAPIFKGLPGNLAYAAVSGTYLGSVDQFSSQQLLDWYRSYQNYGGSSVTGSSYIGWESFASTGFKRPSYNACKHRKTRAISLPFQVVAPSYDYFSRHLDNGGNQSYYFRWPFPSTIPVNATTLDAPLDMRARAWWSMQPRFESEVSMLNFIFELKDFRDMAKMIMNGRKTIQDFNAFINKNRGRLSHFDLSRPAAEIQLLNSYAIQPTIKDVAAIGATIIRTASEAQERFKCDGQSSQKTHYTEVFQTSNNLVPLSNNWYMLSNGWARKHVFTATMRYKYAYKDRSVLDAFIRYWGLDMTAEAFWNMIPFSFLVDYFAQVANSLHMMNVDPNVDLQVGEYTESMLHTHTSGIHISPDPGRSRWIVDGKILKRPAQTLICGLESTEYVRKLVDPYKGPALPRLRRPSFNQSLNMLALARCLF